MDFAAKLRAALADQFDKAPIQVWPGVVQSVQAVTCTVLLSGTELVAEGVNLRADEEAATGVLLTPKAGSLVFVASLENSLDSLFVCLYSEVDTALLTIGEAHVVIDSDGILAEMGKRRVLLDADGVALTDGQVTAQFTGGRASISNSQASLSSLFADVASLFKSLKVICAAPGQPSPTVDPGTLAKIAQFEITYKQLLA